MGLVRENIEFQKGKGVKSSLKLGINTKEGATQKLKELKILFEEAGLDSWFISGKSFVEIEISISENISYENYFLGFSFEANKIEGVIPGWFVYSDKDKRDLIYEASFEEAMKSFVSIIFPDIDDSIQLTKRKLAFLEDIKNEKW